MNKSESKYFNTAIKMDKALLALLEKKDFEYITIKEICTKAEVNRSTFYLHYENTRDLLAECSRFVIDGFLSYFPQTPESFTKSLQGTNHSELIFITPEYLVPYLTYIRENKRLFKTMLKHIGTMAFEKSYNKMFQYIFDPILARFDYPKEERAYVMKFYLTGITAVSMEWIANDCKEEIGKMVGVIRKCILENKNE